MPVGTATGIEQFARVFARRRGYEISDRLARSVAKRARTVGKAARLINQTLGRAPGLAPNFGPLDLDGCVLLVDPNDESTKTVAGGNVTAIRDKAQGLSFSVPAGANAPADGTATTGDGRTIGALDFDDANSEGLQSAGSATGGGEFTAFVIATSDDLTANQATWSEGNTGTSANWWQLVLSGAVAGDPVRLWESSAGGTASQTAESYVSGEPYLIVGERTTSQLQVRLDGIDAAGVADSAFPSGLNVTSLGLVNNGGVLSNFLSGKILAVLVYDRVLSDAERALVEDYLHRAKIHDPGAGIPAVGLVFDLDATVASTITDAGSGKVSAWDNRANKGIASVTQGTGANRPTTGGSINGLNALTFDESASQYLSQSDTSFTQAPFTWQVVAAESADADSACWLQADNSASNGDFWRLRTNAGLGQAAFEVNEDGVGVSTAAKDGVTEGGAHILSAVAASNSSRTVFVDGVAGAEDTANLSPGGPPNRTAVGVSLRTANEFYANGEVGRILGYKRALSDAERARGERALAGTWGVTLA